MPRVISGGKTIAKIVKADTKEGYKVEKIEVKKPKKGDV